MTRRTLPPLLAQLASFWPRRPEQAALVQQYAALRQFPLVLADIALRGGVHAPLGQTDPVMLAVMAGRHDLACEILRLAGQDPGRTLATIDAMTQRNGDRHE